MEVHVRVLRLLPALHMPALLMTDLLLHFEKSATCVFV